MPLLLVSGSRTPHTSAAFTTSTTILTAALSAILHAFLLLHLVLDQTPSCNSPLRVPNKGTLSISALS